MTTTGQTFSCKCCDQGTASIYDHEGTIDRISAPLEPLVDDIVFHRAASGDATAAAFSRALRRRVPAQRPAY